MAFYFAVVAISCYFFLGALLVERVPADIGALACALLIVLLVLYIRRRHKPFNIVERAMRLHCRHMRGLPGSGHAGCSRRFQSLSQYTVRGDDRGRGDRVPLLERAIPHNAHGFSRYPRCVGRAQPARRHYRDGQAGLAVAMLIVLFYSIELVLNNIWRRWDLMRLTTYVTLAMLGLRGVMGALA